MLAALAIGAVVALVLIAVIVVDGIFFGPPA